MLAREQRPVKVASEVRQPSGQVWVKYLRLLDGDSAGVAHRQMGAILFPPESEYSDGPYPDDWDAGDVNRVQADNKKVQEAKSLKGVENGLRLARQLSDGGWRKIAAAAIVPGPQIRRRGKRSKSGKGRTN